MKGLGLALLLGLVVAGSPCVYGLKEAEDKLIIDLLRKDRVDGSYVSPKLGCGIVFNATKNGLLLSTLSGHRLLSMEEQVGPIRLVTLGNREFVQHREGGNESEPSVRVREYAIPKYHRSYTGTQDHETFMNLVGKLRKVDPDVHAKVLKKSVKRALSKREINLLSDAVIAMGQRGITSQDYPSILPLYMTASRIASHSDTDVNQNLSDKENNNNNDYGALFHVHKRLKREDCLSECPPCESQECLSMCGPGCECWSWLCGDCCYHTGCYHHDLCCRAKPNSLACLVPMSFDCESKYVCADSNSQLNKLGLRFNIETN